MFGFRPRNQNVRFNFEIQTPEFLMSGEVLRRDAKCSVRDQREISLAHLRIKFLFRMRIEPRAVASKRMHQEQFGDEWG